MSVERILIVFNPDGTIKGIASYAVNGAAEEMSATTAASLLPHADLLAQVQALHAIQEANEKRAADAEADRDAKVAAAESAKVSAIAAAEADRDEKVAEAESAKASALAEAVADRDAKIAEMFSAAKVVSDERDAAKARVAELEAQIAAAAVPDDAIHIAYFEAALADMGHLESVTAAISGDPVRAALWRRATSIRIGDADVVAVAEALEIDLQAVLAKAKAIQASRA